MKNAIGNLIGIALMKYSRPAIHRFRICGFQSAVFHPWLVESTDMEPMVTEGRLHCPILHKVLEQPWSVVSVGDPGTNPPQVPRDDYTSGGIQLSFFHVNAEEGCMNQGMHLVKNGAVFALHENNGPGGQVFDVPRSLSGGLEMVNLFIIKEELGDGQVQSCPP